MTWTKTRLMIHRDNSADGTEEIVDASVNEHELYVWKSVSTWQIANAEGLWVKDGFATQRAAREEADKIGPMNPLDWTKAGVRKWRIEDPAGFEAALRPKRGE